MKALTYLSSSYFKLIEGKHGWIWGIVFVLAVTGATFWTMWAM